MCLRKQYSPCMYSQVTTVLLLHRACKELSALLSKNELVIELEREICYPSRVLGIFTGDLHRPNRKQGYCMHSLVSTWAHHIKLF